MTTWMTRAAKVLLFMSLVGAGLAAWAVWSGNRDVPPATLAQQQQSYQRAVDWLRANEAQVLQDPNSGLWWMVHTAAQRTGDTYLQTLVRKSVERIYVGDSAGLPWRRTVEPKAEIVLNLGPTNALTPDQQFFYHALTCVPVAVGDGDTTRYLKGNTCSATEVWLKDPVCSTHQLFGLWMFQQTGCTTSENLPALQSELLADIDQQMRLDVMVKDAYLQRVLALMWMGSPDRVKPVWMQRVLAAQLPDGGWAGHRQVPEFPSWLQPWRLKSRSAQAASSDFHATAQGLLIMALATTAPVADAITAPTALKH